MTERARAEFERLLAQAEGEQISPYGDIKKSWERVRGLTAEETNDPEIAEAQILAREFNRILKQCRRSCKNV